MSEGTPRIVSAGGLVVGAVLGMAGTFAPSSAIRGVLWGLDGVALVVAGAFLTVHFFRKGADVVAAGFLTFVLGETLVLATAAMDLAGGGPVFGAGAGLWAASLFILSGPRTAPVWVRVAGVVAGALFLVVALQVFAGRAITALSRPLPFFAYPVFVATLLGWAWVRLRDGTRRRPAST